MKKNFLLLLLAAMFTMVSCENNNAPSSGEEGKDMSDQCKCEKSEIDPFVQSLQGNWVTDSLIHYDEEWKEIELVLIENGYAYLDGISSALYTFNADGILTYTLELEVEESPSVVYNLHCFYSPESNILTAKNCEGITIKEYTVSGYDGEYLMLDYTEHLYDSYTDKHTYRYVREILKKLQN